MVHQHFSLVHDMTVVDNVILGQQRGLREYASLGAAARALANDYGFALDPYAKIDDLSVGERQRVEIVKCLIREPRLFLLDEPTAVLLPDEIAALLDVCRRVAESGCAVVLVTHKLAEIKKAADRVTVLRGGRVVARSDHPAEEIDALVRAMIQGDLKSLDKSAASALGVGGRRHESCQAAPTPHETPAQEAVQIDGLTVIDAQGVTRLDNFTLTDRTRRDRRRRRRRRQWTERACRRALGYGGAEPRTRIPRRTSRPRISAQGTHRRRHRRRAGGSAHASAACVEMSVAENMFLNRLERFHVVRVSAAQGAGCRRRAS